MTGSQQAPESSLLLKGNYKEKEKQSGVCLSHTGSEPDSEARFVLLTTAP